MSRELYLKLINLLTEYEESKKDQFNAMAFCNAFYSLLVDIQNEVDRGDLAKIND